MSRKRICSLVLEQVWCSVERLIEIDDDDDKDDEDDYDDDDEDDDETVKDLYKTISET